MPPRHPSRLRAFIYACAATANDNEHAANQARA